MRLVRNPSHKHSEEITKKFNLLKDNIFYKDHTSYEPEQIKSFIKIVELCKSFGLKSESTKWISKQVIDLKLDEKAANEDYIPVLLGYQKYKSKGLKQLSEYVSVIELNYAIQEIVGETSEAISSEEFGIIDEHNGWLLTIPYTVEASCSLGSKTVWCTARRDNENRFFNYIFEDKVILFYALNLDKSVTKERKISIGFKDGILIEGSSGVSETVDENNNPLSEADLIRIFDRETYERFYKKMKEKLELINNEHPLITKLKASKNNIRIFNKLTDQEKVEVLKMGDYSYEFASYFYDSYFVNATKTIFLSDLVVEFLSNVSNVELVKKLYENQHLFEKHKSYMFLSKNVPEFLRREYPQYIVNGSFTINHLNDADFVLNIFSYVDYESLSKREKITILTIISNFDFDSPSKENISLHEKAISLARLLDSYEEDDIIGNIVQRTFSKKILASIVSQIKEAKNCDNLFVFLENKMFDEYKIEIINNLDIHRSDSMSFVGRVIEREKVDNDSYPLIRNKIISLYSYHKLNRYYYNPNEVAKVSDFVLRNEEDPLIKAEFFNDHSDIDYFTNNELLFIFNQKQGEFNKKGNEVFKYSLFLKLHKLFPKQASASAALLCMYDSGIRNIRTDNHVLKTAIREVLEETGYYADRLSVLLRNTVVNKSLLMDLIKADVHQYISYAKEIEGPALEFVFKNLDLFLDDKYYRAAVELEDFMRSKNFKTEFLFEIDDKKIKKFFLNSGEKTLMLLASFDINTHPASRELIINHAIRQGITTEEEIQRIINSKKKSLDQMAKSKNLNELLYVASQKNLTRSIIETLKSSRRKEVLDALLDNPDIYLSDLF